LPLDGFSGVDDFRGRFEEFVAVVAERPTVTPRGCLSAVAANVAAAAASVVTTSFSIFFIILLK